MFRRLLVLLMCCLLYYQAEELVGYDWSNQYGYANINGNVLWNKDWNAGPFFFDGIWSTNPGLMGPNIKTMFLNNNLDTTNIKKNIILSNFDYVQGDYLQDELSVSLKHFNSNKNFIDINGFKRSYAGVYNQYTPAGSFPKPIHQTYTIHFEINKKNEKMGIAIGHFNTLSGIPIDKNISRKALYDSRITSNNIFWSKKYNYFNLSFKNTHFLQRFYSDYSNLDSSLTGIYNLNKTILSEDFNRVRYLNRQKREIYIDLDSESKFRFNFHFKINSRSIRTANITPVEWGNFLLGINYNKNSYLRLGSTFLHKKNYTIYDLGYTYKNKKVLIKLFSEKSLFPSHPYFGQNSHISILSNSEVKMVLKYSNFKLLNWVDYNSYRGPLFFNKGEIYYDDSNISLGSQIDWYTHQFYKLSLKYLHNQGGQYLNDGVKNKLSFVNSFNLKAFKGVLDLSINMAATGWWDRQPSWYLHLVESVPIPILDKRILDDIWFFDLSISAMVASFTITYKWKNLSSYLERLGHEKFSNDLSFHPLMPEVGSQNSLKIIWEFLD